MARVSRHAGWVVLLGWLVPALALAEAPRFLALWSSSPSEAEAKKALEEVKGAPWADMLQLGEGYPKIEESSKLPGLRAGAWVVTLGACAKVDEAGATTDLLRAVGKAFSVPVKAYVRKVQDKRPLACPVFLPLEEGTDEKAFVRMGYSTRSSRHKLQFFYVPWDKGQPPSLKEGQDPIVVLLMVDGRATDGRIAPLDWGFLEALQSEHSPLVRVDRPDTATRFITLLRDHDGSGEMAAQCDALDRRDENLEGAEPEEPAEEAPRPSPWKDHYELFKLSELDITWDDKRLLKVRRKPLGYKCCRVYTDFCDDSVVLKPEQEE